MFLIDTNVISEVRKGMSANPGVMAFMRDTPESLVYLPVQALGELQSGVERVRRRGDAVQAGLLTQWLETLLSDYEDRILDFDRESARLWGMFMGRSNQHAIDRQMAAIAMTHDMTLVTRNVKDVVDTGVRVIDPFNT